MELEQQLIRFAGAVRNGRSARSCMRRTQERKPARTRPVRRRHHAMARVRLDVVLVSALAARILPELRKPIERPPRKR